MDYSDQNRSVRPGQSAHIYQSQPFWKRAEFLRSGPALLAAWLACIGAAGYAYWTASHSLPIGQISGLIIFGCAIFTVYLGWITARFLNKILTRHMIVFHDDSITIFIESPSRHQDRVSVNRADIAYIEHKAQAYREHLTCYLKNGRVVEIPLSALGSSGHKILAVLRAADLKILTT